MLPRVVPNKLNLNNFVINVLRAKDTVIKVFLRNLHIVPFQLLIVYLHPPFSLKLELPIQILEGKWRPLSEQYIRAVTFL